MKIRNGWLCTLRNTNYLQHLYLDIIQFKMIIIKMNLSMEFKLNTKRFDIYNLFVNDIYNLFIILKFEIKNKEN